MARFQLAILLVGIAGVFCFQRDEAENFEYSRKRERRSEMSPDLDLELSLVNVTSNNETAPGSHFGYSAVIKHNPDRSMADAQGIHVLWMLAPFIKYDKLMSWSGPAPKVLFKDDSIIFKFAELMWGTELRFTLKVTFDPERSLSQGLRHVVTPVRLSYYKTYQEDKDGNVITKDSFFSKPLVSVSFKVKIPGCLNALGMESVKIENYQITASSSYPDAQPAQARPQGDAWCAISTDQNQFIQVDFLKKTKVTKIETFGRRTKFFWIKKYVLQYSNDEVTWFNYSENGFTKKFTGNNDRTSPSSYWLRHPIEAYSVRLWPLDWEKLICLRLELYGCTMEETAGNCIVPLGLESGYIPDEALSHSVVSPPVLSKTTDIRLNKKCSRFPFGWQAQLGKLDHIQVDLGSLHRVARVGTQGAWSEGSSSPFFVSAFQLKYSNNSLDWLEYKEDGKAKKLKGPKDNYEAKYSVVSKLTKPVVARYIRIVPTDAPSLKIMRMELYGCFVEPVPPYAGVSEYARRSYLFDTTSQRFFVCLYSDDRGQSSCFSTKDGKNWTAIEPYIISVIAANPNSDLFGLDRLMNFYRSRDSGMSWVQISAKHFNDVKREVNLTLSRHVPENLATLLPTDALSIQAPGGDKWGVSGTGLHFMKSQKSGESSWETIATWKCCGF